MNRTLRVLVACEMSGRVRRAFADRGWDAWSCDILASEEPDYGNVQHIQDNVLQVFKDASEGYWDLIICHPPCDHLSYAGARFFKQKQADGRQAAAAAFFMEMVDAPSTLVAVENPHSIMQKLYRMPDQIIQPWQFGDPYVKGTHLWLKGLPRLQPNHTEADYPMLFRTATGGGSWRTDTVAGRQAMNRLEDSEGRKRRAIVRSRTFPGIARAMANQWGMFAEEFYGV
jgi:hypothetical protein